MLDAALLHEVVAGHDPLDSTSLDVPVPPVVEAARHGDVRGLRVGVVRELTGEGYQAGVQQRFDEAVELLRDLGAEVVEVSCPHFPYALAAYYLILPSEASSNLAKFDGMRFGLRVGDDGTSTTEQVMARTRAAGFGDEVVRRIILGTYALSAGYYDAYYGSAQKVRTLVQRDFAAAFEHGRRPGVADGADDGVQVRREARRPARDVPQRRRDHPGQPRRHARACRCRSGSRPRTACRSGLQVMAPALADDRLYRVGAALEAALLERWGAPILGRRPGARGRGRRMTALHGGGVLLVDFDDVVARYDPVLGLEVHVELEHRRRRCSAAARRRSAPRRTRTPARPASACPARCRS